MIQKLWFEDHDLSYLKVVIWRLWYEGYDLKIVIQKL